MQLYRGSLDIFINIKADDMKLISGMGELDTVAWQIS